MTHARPQNDEPRELRVFLVSTDDVEPEALARTRLNALPRDERERYDRIIPPAKRHEFLVTRVLCRHVLAQALDVPADSLAFEIGPYGKPELRAEMRPLRFNLSNTNGLVACAVTRGDFELGLDIEVMERNTDTVGVADRFFSAAEVQALRKLPAHAQKRRFFELWTLKEAYIKARGLGLAIPLGSFSFALDDTGGPPRIGFDETLVDEPDAWWFEQGFPSAKHALAIAAKIGRGEAPPRTTIEWLKAL